MQSSPGGTRRCLGTCNRKLKGSAGLVEACGWEFKLVFVNSIVNFTPVTLGCRQGVGGGLDWPEFG